MTPDPIVEEVRRLRDEYAAEFGFDLDALFDDLKAREAASGIDHEARDPKPYRPERPVAA